MKPVRMRELLSVASALALLLLLNGIALAGLVQDMRRTLFDSAEASNPVRDFVPPFAGSDIRPLCVGAGCPYGRPEPLPGPALRCDWTTGNLSATIPAALLNVGSPGFPTYEKIYTIADLTIDSRMLLLEDIVIDSTVFGWPLNRSLEVIPSTAQTLQSASSLIWQPVGLNLPPSWMPPNGPVAAVVDFGFALPSGLSQAELEQTVFPDPSLNFVEYFNHRGVISFRAPLSIEVVPEPSTLQELVIISAIACLALANRRSYGRVPAWHASK